MLKVFETFHMDSYGQSRQIEHSIIYKIMLSSSRMKARRVRRYELTVLV